MPALQLLGVPALRRGDVVETLPSTRPIALLVYLAHRETWVARDEVATVLWPESDEAAARHALRQLVYRARRLPWAPAFEATDDHLRWHVEHDVAAFRRCLATADWDGAARAYAGPFLDGLSLPDAPAFDAWCDLERDALRRGYVGAVVRAAAAHELHRRYAAAATMLETARPHDPWSEPLAQALIRCLVLDGQPGAAVAAYERFRRTLAEEVGTAPAEATQDLVERVRRGARVTARPHNLAGQATPFVGRVRELRAVAVRLGEPACRLLTLAGPGGIGKTRLALQAAADQVGAYPHGVFVIALAAVADLARVATAIAEALGSVLPSRGDPSEHVRGLLRDRDLLLVLDNLEHIDGAARWIGGLLDAAPGVTVLATSREPLGVAAEWVLPLDGLDLPEGAPDGPAAGSPSSSAERLFVLGAERVRSDFAVDAATAADIARVCRLVAGVPLAIELAAGWTVLLTPAQIARAIERDIGFLERPDRTEPAGRHDSLRAVFDASWDRLTGDERALAMRLSPFAGVVDLGAVEAVAGPVLPTLHRLVGRAFVRRSGDGFAMHELVHQFVRERLAEQPDVRAEAERRYARAVVDRVHAAGDAGERDGGVARLGPLVADAERAWGLLRDAHEWSALERLLPPLFEFHDLQGRSKEFLAGLDATLIAAPDEPNFVALVRALRAGCLQRLGRYEEADRDVSAALERFVDAPDAATSYAPSVALRARGNAAYRRGDLATAEAAFGAALELAERLGHRRYEAGCLSNLGIVFKERADLERAAAVLRRACAIAADLDDAVHSQALNNLATVQARRGAVEEAEELLRRSAELKRALGDDRGLAHVATNLANLRGLAGDLAAAEVLHREALALSDDIGDVSGVARSHKNLGDVASLGGDLPAAIAAYERCVHLKVEIDERAGALEAYALLVTCHERADDPASAVETKRRWRAYAARVEGPGPPSVDGG